MYGIVNKAIQDMVCGNYGSAAWSQIKSRSGVSIDFFGSNESYPDEVTYRLALAASEELAIPLSEVLRSFGHHWILHTGKEKYGPLMEAGGANLKEFLMALPQFHNRILLMFPQLCPPEFGVEEQGPDSVTVQYYSEREGLDMFVLGLLEGLGMMFRTPVTVIQVQSRNTTNDPAIFSVTW